MPTEEQYKRRVAYKFRIGDLLKGKPILNEEKFSFLELGDKKISRVNIVGNVVEKFESENEKKYAFFTLDDATGQIQIRTFGEDSKKFKDITEGDTVLVIGNLRFFNNELYVLPEIIKKKEPAYLVVRKLETEIKRTEDKPEKNEIKAIKDEILEMIRKAEPEQGIDIDKIIISLSTISTNVINEEIQKMLEEGIIYEPRPGKVRYLGSE